MIYFFREGLKLFIKVEIEQQDRESVDFEEMVQKIVKVEVKAGLRSSTMVQDLDIRCPKDHNPFNSITSKVQTQETTAKDSYPKEFKVKKVTLTLSRVVEASKLSE